MVTTLFFPIVKLLIVLFLILFLLFLASTILFGIIGYFYTRRIAQMGNWYLRTAIENRPQPFFKMMNADARKTTSFQEVVFLCSRIHLALPRNHKIKWTRTDRAGREAVLHGAATGKDGTRFALTLHFKRKTQKWRLTHLVFKEDISID